MEEKVDPIDIEDSISSIGSISQEFVVPVAPRSSYLPSWVLKFREKIELSREATDVLESRLDSLSLKTKELDDQILILRPKLKRASTGTADQQINSLVDSSNNGVDNNAPRYMMHLYFLPVDIIGELLQYLEVIDVCHLEIVSTAMKSTILDSEMWTIYHQAYFRIPTRKMTRIGVTKSTIDIKSLGPYPQLSLISNDVPLVSISYLSSHRYHMEARQHVIQHAKQCKDCVRFIRLMKDQRAVPKHRGIQPHRHSKAERHVTHPLPVFDRNQNTENALIMSHAETFNSDFRQIANRALDIMYSLTSRRFDPVNEALASEGAVSVLVSLLSNEAGAFQSYSCGILANLLCWEARKPWIRFHESQKHSIASDSDRHDNRYFHQHQTTHFLQARTKSIYQQVHACNGTRMLVSLLTSPTASINLAGGTPVVTGGFREGRMTSSVQGVSTKQACRALANLLDPLMSLPAPALHATGIYNTADLTIDASEASDDHINRPANLHTPFMASFILHEEEARQWRFTYYHKSGALKDRFNAYLKFSVDGYLRGRGVDLIGIFYVTGKVDIDITGYAWYFHKTYVTQTVIEEEGMDVDTWLQLAAEDPHGGADQQPQRTKSHVSHLGYWSEGRDEPLMDLSSATFDPSELLQLMDTDAQTGATAMEDLRMLSVPGVWGLGLYGVWETAANNSHFDLQKGGIFRANPVMAL